mgnify:CR=1 FL=1
MNTFALELYSDQKEPQILALHKHRLESSITDIVRLSENRVFNNHKYTGRLQLNISQPIDKFEFFLNGKFIKTDLAEGGTFKINDSSFGSRLFIECYGYIQLSVKFYIGANLYHLDTDYVPVMVRKGIQNESVRRMTEYVYRNRETLLFKNTPLAKDISGLKDSSRRTVESKILLLQEIGRAFENNYAYFKANSRFTTVQEEYIDHFEKLQCITNSTLQFITQHPDELQRITSPVGIKIGKHSYQPVRTLITNNVRTYNIYENREILNFLFTLLNETGMLLKEIDKLISNIPQPSSIESEDYVMSASFMYSSTHETLITIRSDVRKLENKYKTLFSAYKSIFQIDINQKQMLTVTSKPTPIFTSIPQYRQVYDCMIKWFKMGVINLYEQEYLLSFLKVSSLYESYVLLKIINYFTRLNYRMANSSRITYQTPYKALYENTKCNNIFIFERGESRISVYYQPVITNNPDKNQEKGIGLYRNTTLSLSKEDNLVNTKGTYYTPDFLIKSESDLPNSTTKYIFVDAKFSTVENVQKYQVSELVYKYLFSISPIELADTIVALLIINGQSEKENDNYTNIYDSGRSPEGIMPYAKILTLTENNVNNTDEHSKLLKEVIGRCLS